MVKLFRNVRRGLSTKGNGDVSRERNLGKYLLYALGEIVLLIVGILLALQINNANQKQQNLIKEESILKALKEEFNVNVGRYKETIDLQKEVLDNAQVLLSCLEKKDVNYKKDSISYFITVGALNYFRAEPVLGTYDALKGSGDINLISNASLKSKLAAFASEVEQGFEDEVASMNLLDQLQNEFSSIVEPLLTDEWRSRYGLSPLTEADIKSQDAVLKEMYSNERLMTPLILRMTFESNRLQLQNNMLNYSNEILELINQELK